jgi:Lanthionine synthetase C-like protein
MSPEAPGASRVVSLGDQLTPHRRHRDVRFGASLAAGLITLLATVPSSIGPDVVEAQAVRAAAPAGAESSTVRPRSVTSIRTRRLALEVVRMAADSLVARRVAMPSGGWAWRSGIQAPHFHTDRDVGAASVGEGLLAAYSVTGDHRYLNAAVHAGDYLLGIAEPDGGGLRWPDWADPDGARSDTHFTSHDDGAAGISDYLARLHRVSGMTRFRTGALAGVRWLMEQARSGFSEPCPHVCTWPWTDDPTRTETWSGFGMGLGGIVSTLDAFSARTGDRLQRAYARAGRNALLRLTDDGRRPLPEQPGATTRKTGFFAGSAGAAKVLLARDGEADRAAARRLLAWVNRQGIAATRGGLRWPLALDPVGGDNRLSATGFQEGSAGIAWVNLHAYRATGSAHYRETARRAGVWLRRIARTERRGWAWAERPHEPGSSVHTGLDNGAAGIGFVLADLAGAGIEPRANRAAAEQALLWLHAQARRDGRGAYWYEHRARGRWHVRADPSWHWGTAGIAAFAARMAGWSGDIQR